MLFGATQRMAPVTMSQGARETGAATRPTIVYAEAANASARGRRAPSRPLQIGDCGSAHGAIGGAVDGNIGRAVGKRSNGAVRVARDDPRRLPFDRDALHGAVGVAGQRCALRCARACRSRWSRWTLRAAARVAPWPLPSSVAVRTLVASLTFEATRASGSAERFQKIFEAALVALVEPKLVSIQPGLALRSFRPGIFPLPDGELLRHVEIVARSPSLGELSYREL